MREWELTGEALGAVLLEGHWGGGGGLRGPAASGREKFPVHLCLAVWTFGQQAREGRMDLGRRPGPVMHLHGL